MTALSFLHLVLAAASVAVATGGGGGAHSHRIVQAIAHLQTTAVSGSVLFTQLDDGQVRVSGAIAGLSQGAYGFHVHQLGDPTDSCIASGAHFNPEDVTHGAPSHDVRHIGDLGNVEFGADGMARIDFADRLLALNGENSIVGRTLVLHEREDDLGLTDHEDSLTTGNAGPRIACGVIGIAQEASSATVSRSLPWIVVTLFILPLLSLY